MEAFEHDMGDDDNDALAPWWAACPSCGERIEDFLALDLEEGDWTECLMCGTIYSLEYSRLTEE
jgi:hypothetical protein